MVVPRGPGRDFEPIGHDRAGGHLQVRQDRVSMAGNVTVRYLSRLRLSGWSGAYR